MRTKHLLSFTIFVALVGCKDNESQDPTGNPTGDPTGDSEGQTNTSAPATEGTTEAPQPTSTTGAPDGTSGSSFIIDTDMASTAECDVFAQDCPDGQKCMPYANDGGGSWNAAKCTPLDANPKQPGDDCIADGGGVSGIDNCDEGTMCWFLDENNEGTCIEMCDGTAEAPTCPDPKQVCDITNNGVIIVCLDTCDPTVVNCMEGLICFPGGGDNFICDFDASGEGGQAGTPCAFVNVCDPGLFCAAPELVPNCPADSTACCTEFCDLTEDPSPCMNGASCVTFFEEGTAPAGLEHVGACILPA
jgi:hypothetical protein